jgi:hypothetical protein
LGNKKFTSNKIKKMNRQEAKRLSETITNSELNDMFKNAQELINDWNQTSIVNVGMSKGVAFNILSIGFGKDFDETKQIHNLAKVNMLREFGEFLTNYCKPSKKVKREINVVHQDPKLLNF